VHVAGRDVVVPLGVFVRAVDVDEIECVVVGPTLVVDGLKGLGELIVV
jgi:hypothetical protein